MKHFRLRSWSSEIVLRRSLVNSMPKESMYLVYRKLFWENTRRYRRRRWGWTSWVDQLGSLAVGERTIELYSQHLNGNLFLALCALAPAFSTDKSAFHWSPFPRIWSQATHLKLYCPLFRIISIGSLFQDWSSCVMQRRFIDDRTAY